MVIIVMAASMVISVMVSPMTIIVIVAPMMITVMVAPMMIIVMMTLSITASMTVIWNRYVSMVCISTDKTKAYVSGIACVAIRVVGNNCGATEQTEQCNQTCEQTGFHDIYLLFALDSYTV